VNKETCVLVVDDDPVALELMKRYLAQAAVGTIVGTTDALNALRILGSDEIDLVIVDIMMPIISGYDLALMIRKKLKLVALPIIAVTSQGFLDDPQRSVESGIDVMLPKPIDPQRLQRVLLEYLGELS
jgi:CheY-like chemotaxis protein